MSTPSDVRTDLPRIRLGLSPAEWEEFQGCLLKNGSSLQEFFTRKALELIALGREQGGRPPN